MNRNPLTVSVNGAEHVLSVPGDRRLLDLLRDELGLMGVREGCGVGACGTCTVLLDGVPVNACLTLAVTTRGRSVTTIEGLARDGELHPVQQAFLEERGFQCGFCTPGMILTAVGLLRENPSPTVEEVTDYLGGNLCRCAGYPDMIRAVLRGAERCREAGGRPSATPEGPEAARLRAMGKGEEG
ncbi:MAG: (2Fe-2S)-binding protein [Deltaproteobacteria bacterium]|nr:(2Fe-2S)-binding protein [Deltaproteobacteria bacterium]